MKNEIFREMYEEYQKGYSLEQIGKMYGVTRQSVFAGFNRRKYKLRVKEPLPYLMFKNKKYTLRNHGYYAQTGGNRTLMHRDVWEDKKGPIPDGYDIHHINHNKQDNRIQNLELYTKSEHAKKFATGHNQFTKKNLIK